MLVLTGSSLAMNGYHEGRVEMMGEGDHQWMLCILEIGDMEMTVAIEISTWYRSDYRRKKPSKLDCLRVGQDHDLGWGETSNGVWGLSVEASEAYDILDCCHQIALTRIGCRCRVSILR